MKFPRGLAGFVAGLCVLPALSARELPDAIPDGTPEADSLRARVLAVSERLGASARGPVELAPDVSAQVRALEAAHAARDSVFMRRTPLGVPVDGAVLTSGMSRARFHPILRVFRPHPGVDLAAPAGTPIRATADGRVSYTFRSASYGIGLDLDHGGGTYTRYAHLSSLLVEGGDSVVRGQVIGRVGQTGRATGPHLHYETYIGYSRVDPVLTFEREFRVAPGPGGPGDL